MKSFIYSLLFIFNLSTLMALEESDARSIEQIVDHIQYAWNEQNGHGFADHYAQDADFVNIFGMAFKGQQEIEIRHVKILETFLKGTRFEVDHVRLKEINPEVVIAHVNWTVTQPERPDVMKGIFTHVFVKTSDKWEITATQNTQSKS